MVDFSKTGVAPIATPSTPVSQPVVDTSRVIETQGTAETIKSLTGAASNIFDQFITSRDDKLMSGFAQSQLRLADAVDQGKLSSKEARIRMRANVNTFIQENPGKSGDAFDLHKSILSTKALGAVVAEGTEQEQNEARLVKAATDDAFIPVGATTEQQRDGLADYIESKQLEVKMAETTRKIQLKRDELALGKAQRGKSEGQLQEDARKDLTEYVGLQHLRLSNKLQQVVKDRNSGDLTADEAAMQMGALKNEVAAVSAPMMAGAGAEFGKALKKPLDDTFSLYEDILSGAVSATDSTNRLSALNNSYVIQALADPELQRLSTVIKVLGPNALSIIPSIDRAAANYLYNGSAEPEDRRPKNLFKETDKGKEQVKVSFDVIKSAMGTNDKEVNADVSNQLSHVLSGVDVYSRHIEKPQDLDDVLSFIADDKVGKHAATHGGFPADLSGKVADVIEIEYNEVLHGLLRDEFTNSKINLAGRPIVGVEQKETVGLINIEFRGNKVQFVPSDPKTAGTRGISMKTKELNKSIGPVINRMLKVSAHLKGNHGAAAYKQEWESLQGIFFPETSEVGGEEEGKKPQGDDTPDLIKTLSFIESSDNPEAKSKAGALGKFQIMPDTAAEPGFNVKPLNTGRDVTSATEQEQQRFVNDYLSALEKEFGSLENALAAYNAGPGVVKDYLAGKRKLPKETVDYINKFRKAGVL